MTDLIKIMSRLVDPDGKILIPGVEEMVEKAEEEEMWAEIVLFFVVYH